MSSPEEIAGIFSTLHDGGVAAWEGGLDRLRLRVDCQYLAERIDPTFDHFIVELEQIRRLELNCWTDEPSEQIVTNFADIFRGLLDFVAAEVIDGQTVVTCYQSDPELNYVGGTLLVQCRGIHLFDARMREMALSELVDIADQYWNDFGRRNTRAT